MESPVACTPKTRADAVWAESALLTCYKPGNTPPPPKHSQAPAGRATRSQKRVPKLNYFEAGKDDDGHDGDDTADKDTPAPVPSRKYVLDKTPEKTNGKSKKPDALDLLVQSDFGPDSEEIGEPATRPKQQLKDQMKSEEDTRAGTTSKKSVNVKLAPKKKAKEPALQQGKRDGRTRSQTVDEYAIDVSSPEATGKKAKAPAQKAPGGSGTKTKRKSNEGNAVTTNKQVAQVSHIIVEDDDGNSSIFEDLDAVMAKTASVSQDKRALQPLGPNQMHGGGRDKRLVDDQRDRKPHLVAFDKGGPRNQGTSQHHLALATGARSQVHDMALQQSNEKSNDNSASLDEDGMVFENDDEPETQDMTFDTFAHTQVNKSDAVQQEERYDNPQVVLRPQAVLSDTTSRQELGKPAASLLDSRLPAPVTHDVNKSLFRMAEDGRDSIGEKLPHSHDQGYFKAVPVTSRPPTPHPGHKRVSDDMAASPRESYPMRKRAKIGDNGENVMTIPGNVAMSRAPAKHEPARRWGNRSSDDLFMSQQNDNAKNTHFNQRLRGAVSGKDQDYDVNPQKPGKESAWDHDERPVLDAIAQRMYRSLGDDQSRKPDVPETGRSSDSDATETRPAEDSGDRPRGVMAGPYPDLAKTMHGVNLMILQDLKSKESGLDAIVRDYEVNAGHVVERLVRKHTQERQVTVQRLNARYGDLTKMWADTRRDLNAMAEAIKAVDVVGIVDSIHREGSLDRLRSIQGV